MYRDGIYFNGITSIIQLIVLFGSIGLAIYVIIDANKYSEQEWQAAGQNKVLWQVLPIGLAVLLCCCYLGWTGSLLYFLIPRRKLEEIRSGGGTYGANPPGYGAPPAPGGYGAPPASPGTYGTPPPAPDYGTPPPAPGYGTPPPAPGYGTPPPAPGYGTPPPAPGYGTPPPAPGYGTPPPDPGTPPQ